MFELDGLIAIASEQQKLMNFLTVYLKQDAYVMGKSIKNYLNWRFFSICENGSDYIYVKGEINVSKYNL